MKAVPESIAFEDTAAAATTGFAPVAEPRPSNGAIELAADGARLTVDVVATTASRTVATAGTLWAAALAEPDGFGPGALLETTRRIAEAVRLEAAVSLDDATQLVERVVGYDRRLLRATLAAGKACAASGYAAFARMLGVGKEPGTGNAA